MYLSERDISGLEKVKRLNLINSISGVKSANLVGTKSAEGVENLAIMSSVVHVGSNPALLGIIMRPTGEVPRHTYENITTTQYYTINSIQQSMVDKAHQTSGKYGAKVSEFEACGFEPMYMENFHAPFVKVSQIKIGLQLCEALPIQSNGCIFLIGKICHLMLADEIYTAQENLALDKLEIVGIGGLNSYYSLTKIKDLDYVRV